MDNIDYVNVVYIYSYVVYIIHDKQATVVMDDRGIFLLFSTLQQRLECGFCSK